MKKKAISGLVAFAAACIAIATYSKMLPKIALAQSAQAQQQANEERAIRELNAAVEAAWNNHDAPAMDQAFVEDCDLVNVFGEWISGHDKLVKTHTALFAGPLRDSYQRMNVEKVRFVRPDVAVVHVRHHNTDCDGKVLAGDEGVMSTVVFAKEGKSGGSSRCRTRSCDRCQKRLSRVESRRHPNCHWPQCGKTSGLPT